MFNTSTYYNYGVGEFWELTVQIPSGSTIGNVYELDINGIDPKINISWGDGTSTYFTTASTASRTYANPGTYRVRVSGSFASGGNFSQTKDCGSRVIGTTRMRGLRGITSMAQTFTDCSISNIPSDLFNDHPNVTSFAGTFADCSAISGSIPTGLFNNNPLVTTFAGTFNGCSAISSSIPTGLFNNNPLVTIFTSTFAGCASISSIPTGLFNNNPLVTTFTGTFNGCSAISGSIPTGLFNNNPDVTDFSATFGGCSGITSIPSGLFNNNPDVTSFEGTFAGCQNINGIPSGLFNNSSALSNLVVSFESTFNGCTSIPSIPSGLFNNNPLVTTFKGTFDGCTSITSIPSGLFNNNTLAQTFEATFRGCINLTTAGTGSTFANNRAAYKFLETFYNCPKLKQEAFMFDNAPIDLNRWDGSFGSPAKQVDFTRCFGLVSAFTGTQGTAPELWSYFVSTTSPPVLEEGFENTTGPDAFPSINWTLGSGYWAVFDNGVGSAQRWRITSAITTPVSVYQGVNAAFVDIQNIGAGNTSEDFLATGVVEIPVNGTLRFYTRMNTSGNQGTIYQIKVAPAIADQNDPFAYSLVQQWTEDQLIVPTSNFNIYTEKTVDLSAYAGQYVYIAFVKVFTQTGAGTGGDTWYIDNVSIFSFSDSSTPTGGVIFSDCWDGHSITSLTNNASIPLAWR